MVCTTFMVCQNLTEEILLDQSCQSISFYTNLPLIKWPVLLSRATFEPFQSCWAYLECQMVYKRWCKFASICTDKGGWHHNKDDAKSAILWYFASLASELLLIIKNLLLKTMKFAIKNMKFSIKDMKFSITNMKFSWDS